jgi:hypothetical protein
MAVIYRILSQVPIFKEVEWNLIFLTDWYLILFKTGSIYSTSATSFFIIEPAMRNENNIKCLRGSVSKIEIIQRYQCQNQRKKCIRLLPSSYEEQYQLFQSSSLRSYIESQMKYQVEWVHDNDIFIFKRFNVLYFFVCVSPMARKVLMLLTKPFLTCTWHSALTNGDMNTD